MSQRKRMIKDPILGNILSVGIPAFLEALFTTFSSIIDSKMVSVMGITAISAVSVTTQPRLFVFSIFLAINTVTSSLVAKYLGKNDREAANRIFDTVIKLVIFLSIVLGAVTVAAARPIMIAFAKQPDTLEDSVIYFRIVMGGMIFNLLYMAINSALRGCGLTKLTFQTNVMSGLVNIFFNYLLIEGHLGFPAMGIRGAAIATVMGNAAAAVMSTCFAMNRKQYVNIPFCLRGKYRMKDTIGEILPLARSTVTDSLVMRLSLLFIGAIVARIGSFQMAVYSIGMHLMNTNMALGTGLQTAGVALIGKSYGAEKYEEIRKYRKTLTRTGIITAAVMGVLIIACGRWYYGFFSSDPEYIRIGAISCILIGCITPVQTMKFICSGCLLGVGAMRENMIASVISFSCANLGSLIILVLIFHTGIWGVWSAALFSQTVQTAILAHFIRKNPAFKSKGERL